ncbi:hypothetical protein EON65_38905 [archaeon]|nr:MAG: hypothetical protein EON65_38905 [archaeon]
MVKPDHFKHDKVISTWLKLPFDLDRLDIEQLLSTVQSTIITKPKLAEFGHHTLLFILSFYNNVATRRVHYLALSILIAQYSEEWEYMFQPAYRLLCCLLECIQRTRKDGCIIYPPKWTQQVFWLENLLSPQELQGVIFSVDPITHPSRYADHSTGHACLFETSLPYSSRLERDTFAALRKVYGLRWELLHSEKAFDSQFTLRYGVGIVPFIRTIKQQARPGAGNVFVDAWTAYHLAWLQGLPNGHRGRVLIFQSALCPFDTYSCGSLFAELLSLLRGAPRCLHPSLIAVASKDSHCLYRQPDIQTMDVSCSSEEGRSEGANASVLKFVRFLQGLGAADCLRCGCMGCRRERRRKRGRCRDDLIFEEFCHVHVSC